VIGTGPASIPIEESAGFSLVEVVMAVGIVAFCLLAIVGLAGVGMKVSRDSAEEMKATMLGSQLLQVRREFPTNTDNAAGTLPFGSIRVADPSSGSGFSTNFITADGTRCAATNAAYRVLYRISPNTAARSSTVALRLEWPVQSPSSSGTSATEFVTEILWP
jgi:Tfp pilus assembly protein PilV